MTLKLKNMNFINIKISINDIDINEIVVSNKLPFSISFQDFKCFIGHKDYKKIRPLCKFIPEVIIYKIYFDKTKCMYFMIKDEIFCDKYMKNWKKVSNAIKKLIVNLYIIKHI